MKVAFALGIILISSFETLHGMEVVFVFLDVQPWIMVVLSLVWTLVTL